ncbi:hypothetical protein E2C01_077179 [Portunus trituberculatus]|uniref:Uncharacterized protein n=1 Tax=Portunus trituberculatus TaxID=210409 RepID=A0A5B7ILH4_PORTR|nr:hypothetical protein [Portunus trituberculatus]
MEKWQVTSAIAFLSLGTPWSRRSSPADPLTAGVSLISITDTHLVPRGSWIALIPLRTGRSSGGVSLASDPARAGAAEVTGQPLEALVSLASWGSTLSRQARI